MELKKREIEIASPGRGMRVASRLSDSTERLVYQLIGVGMEVHSAFGPGLREQVYEDAYAIALKHRGVEFERQVPFRVSFHGHRVRPIRLDLIVAKEIIVELKAVTRILDVHDAQMLTYLKLTHLPVAILLNFNVRHLRHGIRRYVRQGQ